MFCEVEVYSVVPHPPLPPPKKGGGEGEGREEKSPNNVQS